MLGIEFGYEQIEDLLFNKTARVINIAKIIRYGCDLNSLFADHQNLDVNII